MISVEVAKVQNEVWMRRTESPGMDMKVINTEKETTMMIEIKGTVIKTEATKEVAEIKGTVVKTEVKKEVVEIKAKLVKIEAKKEVV